MAIRSAAGWQSDQLVTLTVILGKRSKCTGYTSVRSTGGRGMAKPSIWLVRIKCGKAVASMRFSGCFGIICVRGDFMNREGSRQIQPELNGIITEICL
jgi:hypothetical protein